MPHRAAPLILVAVLLAILPQARAGEKNHHGGAVQGDRLPLSPALMELLGREMGLIQDGVKELVPAIAAGDWAKTAEIGKAIKASFILKQELTPAQREELHRLLPPEFIERDRAFHGFAGMLAHAAEMKNADVVAFYFYKLNEACVACHSKFAVQRFPGLATVGEHGAH